MTGVAPRKACRPQSKRWVETGKRMGSIFARLLLALAASCGHLAPVPGADAIAPEINTTVRMPAARPQMRALDANGNSASGIVLSRKTGARARVGVAYAARFQAYIEDLENNHGARIVFMGGIRPGR